MDRRLYAYVAALLAAAAALVGLSRELVLDTPGEPVWATLPVLGVCLIAAEQLRVRFHRGNEVLAITLFDAMLAPLIFTFPPAVAVLTVAVAQAASSIVRRTPFIKAAFNVAQWSVATAVGSLILAATTDTTGLTLGTVGWLVVALTAIAVVNVVAVTLVLAIAGRQSMAAVIDGLKRVFVPSWLAGWGINAAIGVLFVLADQAHPIAVLLFPIPLVMMHLAFQGFASAKAERLRLTGLRSAAQTLSAPLDPRDAISEYLREVAGGFESRSAALILVTDSGELEVHSLDPDGEVRVRYEARDALSLEGVLAGQAESTRVVSSETRGLARLLASAGWRDCICAPLMDESQRLGALVVFDQSGLEGDVKADFAVLEALARETAHSLARGRLFENVVEERRKLNQIVSSTSDGIFTLSDDGSVLSWNSGCERITGLRASDVLGRRDALTRLNARTALGNPIDFAGWASAAVLPNEVLITRLDGMQRRLSCAASTATDVDGSSRTLVVVARDITPAEEYQELREQFGRLVEAQAAQRLVVDHLQQAVAPEPPGIDGADIAVAYVASDPSSPTGGDLFDWHLLPTGELHVAVVDVLGHGVAATKDALTVVHTLRFAAVDGTPLQEMVARADQLLSAQATDLVSTVVIARYHPETGLLKVVSGGHPPALVVGADGEVHQLTATGGAIGWPGVGSDNVATTKLGIHESLVLYTDGLIEARKDVLDGMDSLVLHAGDVSQLPAGQFADELVKRSLQGAERRDDSLALVLRRTRPRVVPQVMRWDVEPGNHAAIRRARRGLEDWLVQHRVSGDEVVYVAAELLANAVVVARTSVVLTAQKEADSIVIEVSDDGSGDENLDYLGQHLPLADSEEGRGLFLVRSLSDEVSVMSTAEGTLVRCMIASRPLSEIRQSQGNVHGH